MIDKLIVYYFNSIPNLNKLKCVFILTIFIELESALPYCEQKPQVPNYLRE